MDEFAFDMTGFDVFPTSTTSGPTPDLSGSVVFILDDLSGSVVFILDDLSGSVVLPGAIDLSGSTIS